MPIGRRRIEPRPDPGERVEAARARAPARRRARHARRGSSARPRRAAAGVSSAPAGTCADAVDRHRRTVTDLDHAAGPGDGDDRGGRECATTRPPQVSIVAADSALPTSRLASAMRRHGRLHHCGRRRGARNRAGRRSWNELPIPGADDLDHRGTNRTRSPAATSAGLVAVDVEHRRRRCGRAGASHPGLAVGYTPVNSLAIATEPGGHRRCAASAAAAGAARRASPTRYAEPGREPAERSRVLARVNASRSTCVDRQTGRRGDVVEIVAVVHDGDLDERPVAAARCRSAGTSSALECRLGRHRGNCTSTVRAAGHDVVDTGQAPPHATRR